MDYPYENLSPEKFQLFCQALLIKENPNLQCFPVAQPDGGRDALQFFHVGHHSDTAMFQVKFIRNPYSESDAHLKVLEAIEGELPKIKRQIKRGVKKFVLMTNVPGTAHLDAGTIDKANTLLSSALEIPAMCWWRNDLNRRLDGAWDLKWVYPELMTGPDLLRSIIEGGLSESKERRATTVQAFVAHQFLLDEEVKFKQIDLQNRLLDLFIDVPITTRYSAGISPTFFDDDFVLFEESDEEREDEPSGYTRHVRAGRPGAAAVLLSSHWQTEIPFVVLEGAPGQGKSTITQYLCQVHRMRVLNKLPELLQIAEEHRSAPVRLPIKVDLRDFSAWISKRNPFSAEGEEITDTTWTKSLESFLAALIQLQSGGARFDVTDLQAVFRLSAVLLVLDGLDEVAEIRQRTDVVAEIGRGVERLRTIAASLQVVVTSRPTAFANSPGLPEKLFSYMGLDSVSQELIEEYATKWLKARKLQERQSSEVRRILKEKLGQPHMRDLARNPMQLAILLSLIHTQGASLPDKRTALYDSYVRLFFNREAEKSEVVRDNRDLLIDIHRYLAWVLHTEAEQSDGQGRIRSNGAIEETRLKVLLVEYLTSEGHSDPGLPEKLFTGVVERVVALVSRVQGTYEFEVQPLREYFAGRFLYETAPYSPVGNEQKGTKPDRFDAIARDFYWLNVTRFYAGCYSKGELASLIDRLMELTQDPDFRLLSHPRVLAATLLGDWVFSQHPRSVSEVIKLMLDGIGLRFLLTSNSRRLSRSQPLVLAPSCGRAELVAKCFELLRKAPPADFALDVIDLLRANGGRDEFIPAWLDEINKATFEARTTWLTYGLHLGCLSSLPPAKLALLLSDGALTAERVDVLLKARRIDVIEASHKYFLFALDCVLDRSVTVMPSWRQQTLLDAVAQALDATRYALAFKDSDQQPLRDKWKRRGSKPIAELQQKFEMLPDIPEAHHCQHFVDMANKLASDDAKRWATELAPWDSLVDAVNACFGNRWIANHLAIVGSAVRSPAETCTDASDLFDSSKSLVRRARYARLRAGTPTWWKSTFERAETAVNKVFAAALWFTWASPSTIAQHIQTVDALVSALDDNAWKMLFDSVENAVELTSSHRSDARVQPIENALSPKLCTRTVALLRLRYRSVLKESLLSDSLCRYTGTDVRILRVAQNDVIERMIHFPIDWELALHLLSRAYSCGVISARYSSIEFARRGTSHAMPFEIAKKIAEEPDKYPSFIIAGAEGRCREAIAKKVRPVAKVAKDEGWFE